MKLGNKNLFSYKDTQIQYSVSDHIRFTAKNNKNFNSKDFAPFFYALWCLTSLTRHE